MSTGCVERQRGSEGVGTHGKIDCGRQTWYMLVWVSDTLRLSTL